jgi:tetratricopeptide (TPR) repeat protein
MEACMPKSASTSIRAALAASLLAAAPAVAHEPGRALGEVNFATSCALPAHAKFNLGMAYQHSFWHSAAITSFNEALALDQTCAIAYWGIALALLRNPYTIPTPQALAEGLASIEKGLAVPPKSARERAYLEALGAFYRDHATHDHRSRQLAYVAAMEKLAANLPADKEAQIHYALALAVTASPTDKTFANQMKAGAILQPIFIAEPRHPGVAHYLIHSYDYPPIAKHGLEAAKLYAKIAPDAPHALHMPSHIFTRLGYWQESVEANAASARVAAKDGSRFDHAHALDYIVYANLQMARDQAATKALAEYKELKGTDASFVSPFAVTASTARYAIERGAWAEAAAMPVPGTKFALVDAIAHFARAIGAARTGQPAAARAEAEALARLVIKLREEKNAYWADQVEIQQQATLAWIAFAEGRHDDAIAAMKDAVAREDQTEKHPVTPGPLLPAREMLGEMLLERGRAAEALAAFEAVLVREPNRFRTVFGAGRAAERAGDEVKAKAHYRSLLDIAKSADTERAELKHARAFVSR